MKALCPFAVVALVGWAGTASAGPFCCKGDHCKPIPETSCTDCGEPVCKCKHCSAKKAEKCHHLIEELCADTCCERIKAAKKLGCRLHANWCCCDELVPALVHALLCDTCWEVREAAGWSLAKQGARTEYVVEALYLSSKLDHHYMVRAGSAEALDLLILCRKDCYKDLFCYADKLVGRFRKFKVRPGDGKCDLIIAALGVDPASFIAPPAAPVVVAPPVVTNGKPAEVMPEPKNPMPQPKS